MATLALILGLIGGMCALMGIITAAEVVSLNVGISALANWTFWLAVSGVLFLATIACASGRGRLE